MLKVIIINKTKKCGRQKWNTTIHHTIQQLSIAFYTQSMTTEQRFETFSVLVHKQVNLNATFFGNKTYTNNN